jgi:hypothetical protein
MAYNSETNRVFFERMRNLAVALQNAREEANRLRNIKTQQAASAGAVYATVDGITTAEADAFISYLTDFTNFNDGTGTGALGISRWGQLLPFINKAPVNGQ